MHAARQKPNNNRTAVLNQTEEKINGSNRRAGFTVIGRRYCYLVDDNRQGGSA